MGFVYIKYIIKIYVYSLYEGDMRACLGVLTAGWILIMSELLHVLDAAIEPWALHSEATQPPTIVSSVVTTRVWSSAKPIGTAKRIGTNKDSPLSCLYLAPAYSYQFCMKEIWEHVSVAWH